MKTYKNTKKKLFRFKTPYKYCYYTSFFYDPYTLTIHSLFNVHSFILYSISFIYMFIPYK